MVREHDKTAAFWIMYMDILETYLLFQQGGGGYPIYDIERMCVCAE